MSSNGEHLLSQLAKLVDDLEGLAAAKAADSYVRDHTWVSVGVAAAIAFLLGALSTRRD